MSTGRKAQPETEGIETFKRFRAQFIQALRRKAQPETEGIETACTEPLAR